MTVSVVMEIRGVKTLGGQDYVIPINGEIHETAAIQYISPNLYTSRNDGTMVR